MHIIERCHTEPVNQRESMKKKKKKKMFGGDWLREQKKPGGDLFLDRYVGGKGATARRLEGLFIIQTQLLKV